MVTRPLPTLLAGCSAPHFKMTALYPEVSRRHSLVLFPLGEPCVLRGGGWEGGGMTPMLPFPFRRLWSGYSSRLPVFFMMSSGMVRPMLWAALPADWSWPVGSGLCTSAEGWLCPGSSRSCVGKLCGEEVELPEV